MKKPFSLGIMLSKKSMDDEDEKDEGQEDNEELEEVCQDILDAIKDEDTSALADAIKAAVKLAK